MGKIETGVDKLVGLVNRRKRISVPEAAKELGVAVPVLEEWADFLEEEGIISLQYKLAKTFLVERRLSKEEVEEKAKQFEGKKESFVRRVETAASSIDREAEGLTNLKQEFEKIKKDLGGEIDGVQSQLKELEKFEDLKKNIDKEMISQQQEFKDKIREMDSQISREEKRYEEILAEVDAEKAKLSEEHGEAETLEKEEERITKRLQDFMGMVDAIKQKIKLEDELIDVSDKHIAKLDGMANNISTEVKSKRKMIDALIKESKEKEKQILELQEGVMKKVLERRKQIDGYIEEGKAKTAHIKSFFAKKSKVEQLLTTLEKEREGLKSELAGLVRKAIAFNLMSKSSEVKKHISELEKKFKDVEKKKESFEKRLGDLIKMVRK